MIITCHWTISSLLCSGVKCQRRAVKPRFSDPALKTCWDLFGIHSNLHHSRLNASSAGMYIHIYECVYAYIWMCIYICISMYICVCMYICIHMYLLCKKYSPMQNPNGLQMQPCCDGIRHCSSQLGHENSFSSCRRGISYSKHIRTVGGEAQKAAITKSLRVGSRSL